MTNAQVHKTNQELNLFIRFLKEKNLKFTRQRAEILNTFLKQEKHFSVDELYDIVRKKDSSVGHATVFRTLKLLAECGIAKEVELGDKLIRYEHKYGHKHHDHLICIKCGQFIETVDNKIEELQEQLCKKCGFKPRWHKLEIFGVCKKCAK